MRGEILGPTPILTPPRPRSLYPKPPSDVYASHLILLRKLDQAYEEQGILDPLTWIEVDKQILDCCEKGLLSAGQYVQLHAHIENRLKGTWGGWG